MVLVVFLQIVSAQRLPVSFSEDFFSMEFLGDYQQQ